MFVMNILLANDTSNNDHYGCFSVMNGLRLHIAQQSGKVIYTASLYTTKN